MCIYDSQCLQVPLCVCYNTRKNKKLFCGIIYVCVYICIYIVIVKTCEFVPKHIKLGQIICFFKTKTMLIKIVNNINFQNIPHITM